MHWECGEQPQWGPWKAAAMVSCPQVALRIRPLSDSELEEGAAIIAHKVGDQVRPRGHRAHVHGVATVTFCPCFTDLLPPSWTECSQWPRAVPDTGWSQERHRTRPHPFPS